MHAEIISIGDEIASGQLLDTNSQWLSQRLGEMGIRVLFHTTVGDELDAEADVFRQAIARADLVIATGGLGPTADDLTREALAEATKQELILNAEALQHVRDLFARRNRPMPLQNERQAYCPANGRMIANPHGTAPGIEMDVERAGKGPCRVIALPGVPAELAEMWQDSVVARIRQFGGGRTIVHRRIKCFGAGESQIESMLPDLIRRGRTPSVGITASQTVITLRITAEADSQSEALEAMAPTIETIRQCLGPLVYGEEDDELQDAVARLLRQQSATLATAEWGTAGLLADWLGATEQAQGYYQGGVVVSSERALVQALGVPADSAKQHSPDSDEIARAMAIACREKHDAEFGLAVGPFPQHLPDSGETAWVWLALATARGVVSKRYPFAAHPATLRVLFAKRALDLVRLTLLSDSAAFAEPLGDIRP